MNVIVSGGSIGGLVAAWSLRRAGHDVVVLEKSAESFQQRGSGISIQPPLVRALDELGFAKRAALGVPMSSFSSIDASGRIAWRAPSDAVVTSWGHLYRVLLEKLPRDIIRFETRLTQFSDEGGHVSVTLADGNTLSADLLVGADGYVSTIRKTLLPDVEPRFAGYIAWRGVMPESALDDSQRALFEDSFSLFRPADHGYFLGFFVPGRQGELRRGERRLAWAWLRNVSEADHRALTVDRFGRQHAISMWEGGLLPEAKRDLFHDARVRLPSVVAELVAKTTEPYFQGIVDATAPKTVFGRVVLVGDAASVVRPQTGAGALKAFADALSLSDALGEAPTGPLDAHLANWQGRQLAYAKQLESAGRRAAAESRLGWAFR